MSNFQYTMTVATLEDCKQSIVKWLKHQSTLISSQARIANRVKEKNKLNAKADAYYEAANFIERIVIEKLANKQNNFDGTISVDGDIF